jgi:hypothetical protein
VGGAVDWEPRIREGLGLPRGVEAVEMVVLHAWGFFFDWVSLLFVGEQLERKKVVVVIIKYIFILYIGVINVATIIDNANASV